MEVAATCILIICCGGILLIFWMSRCERLDPLDRDEMDPADHCKSATAVDHDFPCQEASGTAAAGRIAITPRAQRAIATTHPSPPVPTGGTIVGYTLQTLEELKSKLTVPPHTGTQEDAIDPDLYSAHPRYALGYIPDHRQTTSPHCQTADIIPTPVS